MTLMNVLTEAMLKAIEYALVRGYEVEIYRKPDGAVSIKTVKRHLVKY